MYLSVVKVVVDEANTLFAESVTHQEVASPEADGPGHADLADDRVLRERERGQGFGKRARTAWLSGGLEGRLTPLVRPLVGLPEQAVPISSEADSRSLLLCTDDRCERWRRIHLWSGPVLPQWDAILKGCIVV